MACHPSGTTVDIVGIEASDNGRSCEEHDVCGSVFAPDVVVRFRAVQLERKAIGKVTAGATSPYLGHGIGIALLAESGHPAGSRISVGCKDGSLQQAELVELPFYDKLAEIPRGKCVDIPERS